jgi:hypothetical protein
MNTHAASQLSGALLERHELVHEMSKLIATVPVPGLGVATAMLVTVTSLHQPVATEKIKLARKLTMSRYMRSCSRNIWFTNGTGALIT